MKKKVAIGFLILFFVVSGALLQPERTGAFFRMGQDVMPGETSQEYVSDLEFDTEVISYFYFADRIEIAAAFFLCLLFILPIFHYALWMLVWLGRATRLPPRKVFG